MLVSKQFTCPTETSLYLIECDDDIVIASEGNERFDVIDGEERLAPANIGLKNKTTDIRFRVDPFLFQLFEVSREQCFTGDPSATPIFQLPRIRKGEAEDIRVLVPDPFPCSRYTTKHLGSQSPPVHALFE